MKTVFSKILVATLVIECLLQAPLAYASGAIAWTAGGVKLVDPENAAIRSGSQTNSALVADGSGGAWQVFEDVNTTNIVLQKYDAAGSRLLGATGTVVVNATDSQVSPRVVSDGSGGAIVVWNDNRSGDFDVYAQRYNSSGVAQWAANGVAVVSGAGQQMIANISVSGINSYPIDADPSGNLYVTWQEGFSASPIKAQKLNSSGVAQWTAGGVSVTTTNGREAVLIHDGSGGAIVVWDDRRNASAFGETYVQRVGSTGTVVAAANGVLLMGTNGRFHLGNRVVTDGSGGAIVMAHSDRTGSSGLFAQRVNASMVAQWTANGITVAIGPSFQAHMVADGSGGAVLTWGDNRNSGTAGVDVFAQRLNSAGAKQWGAGDVRLTTTATDDGNPLVVPDSSGNYIVYWDQDANGSSTSVFAQKLNASGVVQWAAGGVSQLAGDSQLDHHIRFASSDGTSAFVGSDTLSIGDTDVYAQKTNTSGAPQWGAAGARAQSVGGDVQQQRTMVAADGAGNFIFAFFDMRDGLTDIYAQKLNSSGVKQWAANGVAVATGSASQEYPAIVADGAGGAIIFWWESTSTVKAMRINGSGTLLWGSPVTAYNSGGIVESIVSDGSGGAIVAIQTDSGSNVVVNRVTSAGAVPWGASGILVTPPFGGVVSGSNSLVSDGSGGAIVVWQDFSADPAIRATRLNGSGIRPGGWSAAGNLVTDEDTAEFPTVASDGAGGAVFAWWEDPTFSDGDVRAQRLNSSGAIQWTAGGVAVGAAADYQLEPRVVSSGVGGAIVAWTDYRIDPDGDVYAQRLNGSGAAQWTANGVAVNADPGQIGRVFMDVDGADGAVIVTEDLRNGATELDIYAQRIDAGGVAQWTANGVGVETVADTDVNLRSVVRNGSAGIVVGFDANPSADWDVMGQMVSDSGGGSNAPTLSNKITLSRIKAGASATASITFTLQNTLSGTLTVTFPAGFTVTAAAQAGQSSACLSGFGFTSTTLTATKTNCSGTITLGGATVTNPVTPGAYTISWVNDDPGSAIVFIVDDDQVTVSGAVDSQMTFNVGSQAAATACDTTFLGNGGTVGLGALTTASVASSDVSSVPHICTRVTTNAGNGAVVTVVSQNASLRSVSTPADAIPSSTATLVAGTTGYGLCAGSGGGDSGRSATTPVGAIPAATAPFNGSCSTSAHAVGALTTSPQTVWSISGPSQNAFFRLYVKAAISPSVPAHSDYADTLTFIATGTY